MSLLHKHRIEKVLVVNDAVRVAWPDYRQGLSEGESDFPLACKDERGALRVGAAVGTSADTEERVAALVEAGVDVIVVDTAHGFSEGVLERVRQVKQDTRTCSYRR